MVVYRVVGLGVVVVVGGGGVSSVCLTMIYDGFRRSGAAVICGNAVTERERERERERGGERGLL